MTQKYQMRFAFDHSNYQIIPPDVKISTANRRLILENLPASAREVLKNVNQKNVFILDSVKVKGILYNPWFYFVLDSVGVSDLKVGCIENILYDQSTDSVSFLMRERLAENSFSGYYVINEDPCIDIFCWKGLDSIPDYYALPCYDFQGKKCTSLKHSVICM